MLRGRKVRVRRVPAKKRVVGRSRFYAAIRGIRRSLEYSVPYIGYASQIGKRPETLGKALALVGKNRRQAFEIFYRLALRGGNSRVFARRLAKYFVKKEFDPCAKQAEALNLWLMAGSKKYKKAKGL
jgi:hypothetical protein